MRGKCKMMLLNLFIVQEIMAFVKKDVSVLYRILVVCCHPFGGIGLC